MAGNDVMIFFTCVFLVDKENILFFCFLKIGYVILRILN